jgi:hypothetical protein
MSFQNFPPPVNHQANFESDAWNAFHSLGLGYSAFLIHPSNGPTIWLLPPQKSTYAAYYVDKDVIDELEKKGLVEQADELPEKPPHGAEFSYGLTEEGQRLFGDISGFEFAEGARIFTERVQPRKR